MWMAATPAAVARSNSVGLGCQASGSMSFGQCRALSSLFVPGTATW